MENKGYQYVVLQLHHNNIQGFIFTCPATDKGFELAKCYFYNLIASEIRQTNGIELEKAKSLAKTLVPVLPMVPTEFVGVNEDNTLCDCYVDSSIIKFEIAEFFESKNLDEIKS